MFCVLVWRNCLLLNPVSCFLQSWTRSRPPPRAPTCPSPSSSTAGTSGRTCACSASPRKSWPAAAPASLPVALAQLPVSPQLYLSRHQPLLQLLPGGRQRLRPQLLLDVPAVCVRGGRSLAAALGHRGQVRSPWHPAVVHDDDGPGVSDPPGAHGVWAEFNDFKMFLKKLTRETPIRAKTLKTLAAR